MGGPVGPFALSDASEDFGRRRWRPAVAVRGFDVGLADRVRVVGVAAAAERGVELAAIHGGRDDDVGLVDGEALGGGDGGRVRQADVVRDVVGGQGDAGAVAEVLDLERPAALVDGDALASGRGCGPIGRARR